MQDGTSNTIIVGDGSLSTGDYSRSNPISYGGEIYTGGGETTARGGSIGCTPSNGVAYPKPTYSVAPCATTLQRDPNETTNIVTTVISPVPWGGPFSSGALMCMGDGAVHVFPYTMSTPGNFDAFLTPSNGEAVTVPE
jgi:hypothetical protein